jgi:hypothetical protein
MLQKFTWWMFAITIMAGSMTRAVMANERVVLRDQIDVGASSLTTLPPPPILERTT